MSTTNPTNIPTEWEELQIKHGNLPERPKPITSEALSQAAIEFAEQQDVLENKTLRELDTLEDEVEEDVLDAYRKKRLEELRKAKERYTFGSVVHVGKTDYVKEVTECSKESADRRVILLLYTEAKPVCRLLIQAFEALAPRHGYTKFCKAIGSDVIPDFPESRVPTILVYKGGSCIHQFLGGTMWGGNALTADSVEWVLWKHGVVDFATSETDPRTTGNSPRCSRSNKGKIMYNKVNHQSGYDSADNEDDDAEFERNPDKRGYSSLALEAALRLK